MDKGRKYIKRSVFMVDNLNIIKRDGSIVKFNKSKIEDAILRAMKYGVEYMKKK